MCAKCDTDVRQMCKNVTTACQQVMPSEINRGVNIGAIKYFKNRQL